MEISFTLEEEEDDDGVVGFFQKRERFKNFIPLTSFLLWDQVQCYGCRERTHSTDPCTARTPGASPLAHERPPPRHLLLCESAIDPPKSTRRFGIGDPYQGALVS